MVTARINGAAPRQLMLDTGAPGTVINPRVLAAVGVSYRDAAARIHPGRDRRGAMCSPCGSRASRSSGARVRPPPGRRARRRLRRGADGLLGRDFLDQFSVTIDSAAGIVTLTPR